MKCVFSILIALILSSCSSSKQEKPPKDKTLIEQSEAVQRSDSSIWEAPTKIEIFGKGTIPQAISGGPLLSFSDHHHQSLWILDTKTHDRRQISNAQGSGYHPFISDRYIVHLVHGKRRKWILKDLKSEQISEYKTKQEALKSLKGIALDTTFVIADENLENLMLFKENGDLKMIKPDNLQNFTNAELSPSKDRILFEVSGKGGFISNLEGRIERKLGNVDHLTWLSDYEVVYLKSKDDGMETKSSSLYVQNLKTGEAIEVANDLEGKIDNPTVLRESQTVIAEWKDSIIIGFNKSIEK